MSALAAPLAPAALANPLVVALAYDGLCTFEFGIAVELFALPRPEMGAGWYRFAVAALDPLGAGLRAMGGVRILADGGLDLFDHAGTIIIPGWRGADQPVPPALILALQRAAARGARLMSICSGVFVLAAAGLLDGRRATTHWRYVEQLAVRYPAITVVPDVLYIDDGTVLTSAGSAAGLDLGLHLIRRDFGPAAANSVARRLVVPPHRAGGQAQFIPQAVPPVHEGARFAPLFDQMRGDLGADWTLDRLARLAGMSSRTFLRRFTAATGTTPARWLLAARLDRARDLLEVSDLPVEQLAEQAGFGTAASLRHHFRRQFGISPAAHRAAFSRRPGR